MIQVAKLAGVFAEDINARNIAMLSGCLHDIGKATLKFQNYLLLNEGKRGSVIHSLQGSIFSYVNNNTNDLLLREILSLIISAHHNYLNDGCSIDGTEIFFEKLKQKNVEDLSYNEVLDNLPTNDYIENLFFKANNELTNIIDIICNTFNDKQSVYFALGLLVKFIFSCLIDADRLDAYKFETGETYEEIPVDWKELIQVFEKNLSKLQTDSVISKIRQEISQKCQQASQKETGIYQLSVPTGGGKTFSSLRFALHHCKKYNKKRIIYVIPYLSIIEQTSKNIRSILDLTEQNDIILEHHSNIIHLNDDENNKLKKLASSRWDKPIIITTMVQFLETIISSRASKLRKFHNMSNAVIIFDEIQSLPIKTIHIFNEIISFLSKICNSTILLCTATQPLLNSVPRNNLLLSEDYNLIENTEEAFIQLNRTQIKICEEKDINELSDFVLQKAKNSGNCLVILNTKKSAKDVFLKIKELNNEKEQEFKLFHLSTAMCSIHRFDILNEIIKMLQNNEKIICVTTQLIEAGVDISFKCVVRSLAGLDSIAQAAGRCNRNGESPNPQNVYVVPLKKENLNYLHDIKVGKEITARVIRENPKANLLNQEIIDRFYRYYFFNRKNEMDYSTSEGSSIFGMLSLNLVGRNNYKNINKKDCPCYISHAFHTADNNFSVISKNAENVIVQYKDSIELIKKILNQPKDNITKEIILTIKELRKYSVSLFPWELKDLYDQGAIIIIDEELGIKMLTKDYYCQELGVKVNGQIKKLVV
ncbi:MAG TPA: CRISPR-associated helicase Cas3' [Clostridiales bacterium]|nr:CRISPR-associated helicase Cas3' [Clostridiales bacterium]